jgi:hypothetical protein
MIVPGKIKVLFVAGFGPIFRETATSRKLYSEALGIPLKEESGYLHTEALQRVDLARESIAAEAVEHWKASPFQSRAPLRR